MLIWYNKILKYYREECTVIKLIALDKRLISVVEDQDFLRHMEFLNPHCAGMHTREQLGCRCFFSKCSCIIKENIS